jgi:hypothetical protein
MASFSLRKSSEKNNGPLIRIFIASKRSLNLEVLSKEYLIESG